MSRHCADEYNCYETRPSNGRGLSTRLLAPRQLAALASEFARPPRPDLMFMTPHDACGKGMTDAAIARAAHFRPPRAL